MADVARPVSAMELSSSVQKNQQQKRISAPGNSDEKKNEALTPNEKLAAIMKKADKGPSSNLENPTSPQRGPSTLKRTTPGEEQVIPHIC